MTIAPATELAFLFDVDNTLIDNDLVRDDLARRIRTLIGADAAAVFWRLYEEVRQQFDYVDLPHTLGRLNAAIPHHPSFSRLADLILCYPFQDCLYGGALAAVRHCAQMGRVGVLSDGDPVYQPAKIARAGIAEAVSGNVLVFAHKEEHVEEIRRNMPASHWVLVDDKLRLLALMKDRMGDSLTTVQVCQGKYAVSAEDGAYAPADISLESIADLSALERQAFGGRAARGDSQ